MNDRTLTFLKIAVAGWVVFAIGLLGVMSGFLDVHIGRVLVMTGGSVGSISFVISWFMSRRKNTG